MLLFNLSTSVPVNVCSLAIHISPPLPHSPPPPPPPPPAALTLPAGMDLSETLRSLPPGQSGYLLYRDDKFRWHRSWCKIDIRANKFLIFEDGSEEVFLLSFALDGTSLGFGPGAVADCDKDMCLVISSAVVESETEYGGGGMHDIVFAAYTDTEYKQWREALELVVASRDSARSSFPSLDGLSWSLPGGGGHDSTSTSSSNFSSNRESMVSTASSLVFGARASGRPDSPTRSKSLDRDAVAVAMAEEGRKDTLSVSKQQQPLPSPPRVSLAWGRQAGQCLCRTAGMCYCAGIIMLSVPGMCYSCRWPCTVYI